MKYFSLREAAEHTGKSKSTILRAIQSGRLKAPKNKLGGYDIDPKELFSVYPENEYELLARLIESIQSARSLLKYESRDRKLFLQSVYDDSPMLRHLRLLGKGMEMSVSMEMRLVNDGNLLSCEVGDKEVQIFIRRPDNYMSVDMTKSDMRRLARFILDEVKEEDQ